MEEPENTYCLVCGGYIAPCEHCETFIFCQSCGPKTEHRQARHWDFCEPIHQRGNEYLELQQDERQTFHTIQSRTDVRLKLAEKTNEWVSLMLKAAYPEPLPKDTICYMVRLFNYRAIYGLWNYMDVKMTIPALYICQNEDAKAFTCAVLFIMSRVVCNPNQREHDRGSPPFEDETRHRLAQLREQNDATCFVPGGCTRTRDDVLHIVNGGPIAPRIINLEREIRDLAQLEDLLGDFWRDFWRYMRLPPDCAWRQGNRPENLPEQTQKLLYANHPAWVATPGACGEMVDLLGL
ncbi:hypothetical protein MGU_05190 [Metarhizium guizhouense ARSEF 977]|uniref:Uncharacterized protein n=1 Tax=Metarhizium guizhouense (strain ARSEF 977) TaxID=1276136 RepID=A0A0B4HCN2_METGA|nr:hypothetical protein MGU_05190 [Metarhizium guizhouense ARSEF 977]